MKKSELRKLIRKSIEEAYNNEYSKMLEEPKKTRKGRKHWWQFWRNPLSFDESKLNEEWSAEQCSDSWEEITGAGGNVQGMSIFRKFCCRRGWKCCTRKRPKRNPCWGPGVY